MSARRRLSPAEFDTMSHTTRSHDAKLHRHDSHSAESHDAPGLTVLQCGCALPDASSSERKAVAVDPDAKIRNVKRLRRIEGQVRGLQKMVEEDRYCADILTQISSVHEALRSVGRELMRNHLRHCASAAIRSGAEDAEPMYDEIVDLMYKHSR
jgi:CsoR family transcriptional regulator, copper-sensing transcriptional repressor